MYVQIRSYMVIKDMYRPHDTSLTVFPFQCFALIWSERFSSTACQSLKKRVGSDNITVPDTTMYLQPALRVGYTFVKYNHFNIFICIQFKCRLTWRAENDIFRSEYWNPIWPNMMSSSSVYHAWGGADSRVLVLIVTGFDMQKMCVHPRNSHIYVIRLIVKRFFFNNNLSWSITALILQKHRVWTR